MPDRDGTDPRGNGDAHTAVVPAELAGARCDVAAARLFDDWSRGRLRAWIESGRLTVDGAVVRPRAPVPEGALLVLVPEAEPDDRWRPQELPLRVLHADADVIVIDKPAGLVTHPGAGVPDGTLANAVLAAFPETALLPRAGIVHRLDRDTSGVLVVARSPRAHGALVRALQARTVSRRYLAICEGVPTGSFTVDAPVGRDPARRTRMAVVPSGRPARTHVRLLERFARHAAFEARLETGRTHQIRVHLAHRGFPLVGDTTYGARRVLPPAPTAALEAALRAFPRQALHARYLAFAHPATGDELAFEAPVPPDLTALLRALRNHADAA
jgi:23S rRNA pseudouridine1911/1915/1917 synthase